MYTSRHNLLGIFAIVLLAALPAPAQQETPVQRVAPQTAAPQKPIQAPPDEIQVSKFRVEAVAPPGGGKPWVRLLADFSSQPAWADGIVFYYDVLVAKGEDMRVLSGAARYSNVKRGNHSAVLYMSAGVVERFGAPIAASVRSSYKDETSGQLQWKSPESASRIPQGWESQVQRYPGQLLPISFTPFVATEYGKYPDVMPPR
jgi:hypothetical protein